MPLLPPVSEGAIIVAGKNFGCGSSREQATKPYRPGSVIGSVFCTDILPKMQLISAFRLSNPISACEEGSTIVFNLSEDGLILRETAHYPPIVSAYAGNPYGWWSCSILEGSPVIFPEHCKYVGMASSRPCGDVVYSLSRYLLHETDHGYELLEVTLDPGTKSIMRKVISSKVLATSEDVCCFREKVQLNDRALLVQTSI